MRPATLLLSTLVLAIGLSQPASADVIAYASTSLGSFGTLDLTTGVYNGYGSTGLSTSIFGIGFIGTTLYGVDDASPGAGLYSISTATGAATLLTTLSVSAIGGTTGFGNFYGVSQDIPALLFGATPSGVFGTLPLPFQGDGLVAFDPTFSTLYMSAFVGTASDELYSISTTTDAINDAGPLGTQSFTGIIVGNTLYSTDGLGNIYTYTVSPTSVSGILTTVAISGLAAGDTVDALAAQVSVVPEPSSVVMGGMAIALAGLDYARRRFLVA
jgi:hypothetical protein